jgi:hypothetical protein
VKPISPAIDRVSIEHLLRGCAHRLIVTEDLNALVLM